MAFYINAFFLMGIIALIYYPFGMKYINNKLSMEQKSFLLNCQSPMYLVLAVIIALLSWPAYYSLNPSANHPMAIILGVLILLIGARRINLYLKLKQQGFSQNYLYMYILNTFILLIGLAFMSIFFSITIHR